MSDATMLGSARGEDRKADGGLKAAELARTLRRKILAEAMPVGTPLPSEARLMETYGLSRATVREAIRILDVEGFIEVRRGRYGGVAVRHPGPDVVTALIATQLTLRGTKARALLEMREILEPPAAGHAARRASAADLTAIGELATSAGAEDECRFHIRLATACGNDLLAMTIEGALSSLLRNRAYGRLAEGDLDAGRAAHHRIHQAIRDRDPVGAEAAMREHLAEVRAAAEARGALDEMIVPPAMWRE